MLELCEMEASMDTDAEDRPLTLLEVAEFMRAAVKSARTNGSNMDRVAVTLPAKEWIAAADAIKAIVPPPMDE